MTNLVSNVNRLPGGTIAEFYCLGFDGLCNDLNKIHGYPHGYRYHGDPMRTFREHFGTDHAYADVSSSNVLMKNSP